MKILASQFLALLLIFGLVSPAPLLDHASPPELPVIPTAELAIYDDVLASGWQDWSWSASLNFAATGQVHAGTHSISVAYAAWGALSLRAPAPLTASDYTALDFWAYGGTGGSQVELSIQPTDSSNPSASLNLTFPANTWTHFTLPLSNLGNPPAIARVNWQDRSGTAQPVFYLDNIVLLSPDIPLALSVNVAAGRHSISPLIYGMNQYSMSGNVLAFMDEIDLPVRRWGGNATTRYNWQNDISNHAFDWYFANLKESDATHLPDDSAVNRFIDQNISLGVQSFLVTPMTGFVAKDAPLACGFSVQKYGPQQDTADQDYRPDCGNGLRLNGTPVTGNDPLDTSRAITPAFVSDWVGYLTGRYGSATGGGVRFYNLDNEPDLWWETHRDVSPVGQTYDQLRDRSIQYAAAIKSADPAAQVLGPALGVWSYYFVSPYDGQRGDWQTPDDTLAHGGVPLVAWYLGQMRAYEQPHGVRLLNYLDLHYYPQSGVALVGAGDAARQALRLRSTRSLWDPTYVDESWIAQAGPDGGIVQLIPRMRAWVVANYPGTKLAIGEYNWGALDHLNGALAQADVLGIFGREGVDLATLWAPPAPDDPGAFAFRLYRNYDGTGKKFGEISLQATSTDPERLAIFAAQRLADQAVTLVVINKTGEELATTITLAGYTPTGMAQVYRYSGANLNAIQHLADQPVSPTGFSAAFAANSITLFVLSPQSPTSWRYSFLPIIRR